MEISVRKRNKGGFTLVELLVVIGIIAVLVAISVTMVFRFRKAADKTLVLSNMKQIQAANVSYSSDHSGRMVPPTATVNNQTVQWYENPEYISQLKSVAATYITDTETNVEVPLSLVDPVVAKARGAGFDQLYGSYAYNVQGMPVVSGVAKSFRVAQVADPARTMVFVTAGADAGGRISFPEARRIAYRHQNKAIVCYYDSHAVPLTEAEIGAMAGGATGTFWDADPTDNP